MGTEIGAWGPTDTIVIEFPIWSTSLPSRSPSLHRVHYGCIYLIAILHFSSLAMSTSSNLRELDPPVTVLIYISNGIAAHFPISRKEYLICDLCGRELCLKNRKNTRGFVSHRESKGCIKGKQKEEIISVEEGKEMGIPAKSTRLYREAHDLLNSEDIAAELDADRVRKRASSDTSNTSTISTSRGPSPSKRIHLS